MRKIGFPFPFILGIKYIILECKLKLYNSKYFGNRIFEGGGFLLDYKLWVFSFSFDTAYILSNNL